jgi:3-phosphoshikimate 1-carboxyvinyltransferase
MHPLISRPVGALRGVAEIPGDKSVSHRALMLGALAVGTTRITGLLEADDVMATAEAMRRLGAGVRRDGAQWLVQGRGVGGLREPEVALDMGNAGTGVRLAMGIAAGHSFVSFFTGDASLSARPMARVIEPLTRMGAAFVTRSGGRLPLAVRGRADLLPIVYRLPVASAQVKSAVLLAGLHAAGRTTVIEPQPSRDHTERLLRAFGAEVEIDDDADGGRRVTVSGQPELEARPISVPRDPSSAAFALVAALIVGSADIRLPAIGVNPLRIGLIESLQAMGGRIELVDRREQDGEPVADLIARASPLVGIDVPAGRVPAMIDEFPILAVAAACARGPTRMTGLAELRIKESDRLAAIAEGLIACGVAVEIGTDWMVIHGAGGPPPGGARIATRMDHRIAMAFLVLGMASRAAVAVDDSRAIATSFPGFTALMNGLGARIGSDAGGDADHPASG